jgi:hypothetical protein
LLWDISKEQAILFNMFFLSVETLTEKCPSASMNPDSQALEFKGVKSKGYLLISYPLLLRKSINLFNL